MEIEQEGDEEDAEELLACATCFTTIIYRDDILQEKISSCKEVVYPYELTVCDRDSWCYLVTDQQNHRFDLIRARSDTRHLHSSIRLVASPRSDFTWFPGYAWRSAHCDECSASIGWGFCAPFQCGVMPTDSESKLWNMAPEFLGLVLTRLRPCSKAKAQARHQQYRESPMQEMPYNFVVPPVELPPWWTRTDRGENSNAPDHPTLVDWLDEDPDAAFRRARSPTPPMRVGVRSAATESSTQQEDLEMQSELLRLLREQARVNRSLRMHQFGTPSNVQHVIPRADAVPSAPPPEPPTPAVPGAALAAAVQTAVEAAPQMSETSEANDSGLLRWLRRLLQSRRAVRTPRTPRRREEGTQETLNQLWQRRRESSPPNRTWNLIRQLSSQQQQLAAVRDELLSEQLESSRHLESFQEEQLHTLRSLTARQQQIASEQRQLMEDIIRLQGTVMPSQGQL